MQYSSWRIQEDPKRRSPRYLWVIIAVVAAGGVGAVAAFSIATRTPSARAALQTPPPIHAISLVSPARATHPSRAAMPALSPIADSPAAPAACEAAKAAPVLPGPAIQLVGTVVDRDPHYAMLRTNDGSTRMAKVGDVVAGAQVTAVTRQDATVRFQGRSYTLTVAAQAAAAGPGGRTPGAEAGRDAAVMAILDAQAARESAAASAAGQGAMPAAPALAGPPAMSSADPAPVQAPADAGQADTAQPAPKFDRNYRQRIHPLMMELRAQLLQGRTPNMALLAGNQPASGNP